MRNIRTSSTIMLTTQLYSVSSKYALQAWTLTKCSAIGAFSFLPTRSIKIFPNHCLLKGHDQTDTMIQMKYF